MNPSEKTTLYPNDLQRIETSMPAVSASFAPATQFGVGVPDADAVARDMSVAISANHTRVSTALDEYFNRNRTWWERIFKTRLDKVLEDAQLQQAETELDYQQRMLELAVESRYHAALETVESYVKMLKIGQREKFGSFAAERLGVFHHTIDGCRYRVASQIREAHQRLSVFADVPTLHRRYQESLDRDMAKFFDTVDALFADFQNVVHERVVAYDRPALPSRRAES